MIQSVGTLYGIQDLFDHLGGHKIVKDEFLQGFDKYGPSTGRDVYDTAVKLSWICTAGDGQLVSTEVGKIANCGATRAERLRYQLSNIIETQRPAWASLLPKGRKEAMGGLPEEIKQCFDEAQLFDAVTDELVEWWDRLAGVMREFSQRKQMEIGRAGERLTIKYESVRTNKTPTWQAIETNYAGYDVLSIVEKRDETKLRIEVKASGRSFKYADIYVTEHEWITASQPTSPYDFHVWLLEPKPTLFVISGCKISTHIPKNLGKGRWRNDCIPLSALTHPSEGIVFAG